MVGVGAQPGADDAHAGVQSALPGVGRDGAVRGGTFRLPIHVPICPNNEMK